MRVLVLNAGSSSVKLSVVDGGRRLAESTFDRHGSQLDPDVLRRLADGHGPIDAVGHRVVHGGDLFTRPVMVDDGVLSQIDSLTALAPLHQPAGIGGIRAALAAFPGVANVACFDTAFHATMPAAAATYALPEDWRRRFGVRRFGFHGLSHAWAAGRAAELVDRPGARLRIVSCHLGAGASLCAIDGGRSLDTTMGFTPMEGLVMATRSGSVDPGLVLWLIQQGGLSAEEVNDGLDHRSGLAGLSGRPGGDLHAILSAADDGDGRAVLAVDVWFHRLCREIGAMAAVLGGVDVLVFTGGIGEHAPSVRARAAARLGFLGADVDEDRNQAAIDDADVDISAAGAACATLVIKAGEDLQIARLVGEMAL